MMSEMKRLGFGLMRLPLSDPNDGTKIDLEQVKAMADRFIENGFTYFDTAWMYHGFASEPAVKEVLTDRYPRESFQLATKLHAGFFNSLKERDEVFNEQLKKTGAGYFDYYLLHGVEAAMYPKYQRFDCFRWMEKKKADGLVRHIGFSYHDTPELLDQILTDHPELEFVQLQINYLDWESEWIHSRGCYEVARKHDIPIIVMEPVKGGTLSHLPDGAGEVFRRLDPSKSVASWAIRFAASLPGVMLVLSGMSDIAQLEDNISTMEPFVPLTDKEKNACFEVADIINGRTAIPCTGCSYCTEGCPRHIAIPQYFSLYNEDMRERLEEKGWTINFSNYEMLNAKFGKASDCVECGQCERVCPQHLKIIDNLKKVAAHYEQ